jgi:chromosome partitioning protein
MTDDELLELLDSLESDRVERKESISDPGRIRQAICAFANDMPNHRKPGVIFVGVRDDGACASLSITDQLLLIQRGAALHQAKVALIDLGPNLGAINRAALIASNHVVVPLGPDLFSLQGLRNLGPTLREWRRGWTERISKNPDAELPLPKGEMMPIGYIIMQHSVRRDRPVKSYEKWIGRIPGTYRRYVLDQEDKNIPTVSNDPHCFALLKHYRSLMPMAQEARKPIFLLKPADGALGAHVSAVQDAYVDFETLTQKIATQARISIL